jgi:hypothetical protein
VVTTLLSDLSAAPTIVTDGLGATVVVVVGNVVVGNVVVVVTVGGGPDDVVVVVVGGVVSMLDGNDVPLPVLLFHALPVAFPAAS